MALYSNFNRSAIYYWEGLYPLQFCSRQILLDGYVFGGKRGHKDTLYLYLCRQQKKEKTIPNMDMFTSGKVTQKFKKCRSYTYRIGLPALFLFFLLAAPLPANVLGEDPEKISWHISAKVVTYDDQRNLYIAEDEVVITGGKTRLEADYVEYSITTQDALAQGNVLLISGEDSISCNAMTINLQTQIGTINKGTIFIQKNNFYIYGENIRKTGRFTYSAERGTITSCSGDNPDWKISGRHIEVTVEGYGYATNTVLWGKEIPLFYSPFLVFPVKAKRQTGLLFPRISSSDRKGFEYEQPLFLALSRNTDATVYADYMSDRGVKTAAEYRYIFDTNTKGAIFFDFLEDDKKDDGTKDTSLYSYSTTPQRTNSDRFWFRMKHNADLPEGFKAKLDVDIVSDADYLQEFRDGFTGFDQTREYFEDTFDRGFDAYDDTTRKNWLNLSKSWSTYSFNLDAYWYDNINARRQNTADTTLQTLPSIEFDSSKHQIYDSIFSWSFTSQFKNFYRQDTTSTAVKGKRLDLFPKFYLPLKPGKIFNFEPYVGLRETIWHTNGFTDPNGGTDDFRTREMYTLGADLSTTLLRIFNPENAYAEKIKHEIIPQLQWSYTPHISQTEFPSFDGVDRISEQNLLTWSVTQNLITRTTVENSSGESSPVYSDVAYLKISQSYDIKKERDNQSKPFSNIAVDLELDPCRYFSLETDLTWSPYDSHFKTLNSGGSIKDSRGDQFTAQYRYKTDNTESLYSRVDIALTRELATYYSFEKNLKTNKTLETKAGLSWERSCWKASLEYSEVDAEKNITFLITLNGIGEFGTK